MNRISHSDSSAYTSSNRIVAKSGARPIHAPEYSLFRPMHYESNYAYPLVVYLHGPRGSQRQLDDFMPALSNRNYVGIAPQGVAEHSLSGFCWSDQPTPREIESAYDRVMACIDVASDRANIHPERIFLVGYADGGSMAIRLALKSPGQFAGVVSLCGAFPVGHAPLANLRNCRKLPIWVAAGRDGKRYTVDQTCSELKLFHAAGLSVNLRQYPTGDELDSHMLRDLNHWLMEEVTGVPATGGDVDDSLDESWS